MKTKNNQKIYLGSIRKEDGKRIRLYAIHINIPDLLPWEINDQSGESCNLSSESLRDCMEKVQNSWGASCWDFRPSARGEAAFI